MAQFNDDPRPFGDYRKPGLYMPTIMPVLGMEPSIQLYMPADLYHAIPNIGSSGHKRLRSHPCEFFHLWAGNPERRPEDDDDTPAKMFGRAVHKAVLEGTEALEKSFAPEPVDDDMSRPLLKTMDDMKRLLRPAGIEVSGNKESLATRCRAAFPRARIYDDIMDEHKRFGRYVLKPDAWDRVVKSAAHITMHPQLSRAFKGGRSEISIFWINDLGVRCKARLDYLRVVEEKLNGKAYMVASISDLKSFSMPRQIPILRAIDNAAGENIHQAVHYMNGMKAMIDMLSKAKDVKDVCPDAKPEDVEWLKLVAKCKRIKFHFVFYKSTGAPFADATWHEPNDRLIEIAAYQVLNNFEQFRLYYETFGTELWVNLGEPRHLADEDSIRPWFL